MRCGREGFKSAMPIKGGGFFVFSFDRKDSGGHGAAQSVAQGIEDHHTPDALFLKALVNGQATEKRGGNTGVSAEIEALGHIPQGDRGGG